MGGCGGKKTMSAPFGGMINSSMAEPNNNSGTAPNPTNDLAKQTAAIDQSAQQQQQQKLSVAANKQHEGGLLVLRRGQRRFLWHARVAQAKAGMGHGGADERHDGGDDDGALLEENDRPTNNAATTRHRRTATAYDGRGFESEFYLSF
uniref:Uncharacterized protein n=1 Tax=Globodera rostochiensis TaxID=31243 RepID=A0A914GW77_GLORO